MAYLRQRASRAGNRMIMKCNRPHPVSQRQISRQPGAVQALPHISGGEKRAFQELLQLVSLLRILTGASTTPMIRSFKELPPDVANEAPAALEILMQLRSLACM